MSFIDETTYQQYEMLFNRPRKAYLYRTRIQTTNLQALKNYIAAGYNPLDNPDLSTDYIAIINEYGTQYFEDERNGMLLRTEH